MSIRMNGCFEKIENEMSNTTFERVKIKVHAIGVNQNNSDITFSAYETAKNTLLGVPIVAKYTEEDDSNGEYGDLTSHNRVIKKDKDGNYVLSHDTVPLGFVSPNANIETVVLNEDGVDKTYIVADEVVLWKRYEATQKIMEWLENDIVPSVSMEIGDVDGEINNGSFQINSFQYEAITCLGSNVTPCFPLAQVENYEKQDFNKLYKQMVSEYEEITKQNQEPLITEPTNQNHTSEGVDNIIEEQTLEGGSTMDISKLLLKYNLTNEQLNFSIEGLTAEQIEENMKQIVEFNKAPVVEPVTEPVVADPVAVEPVVAEPNTQFELSNNQLETAIRQELAKKQVIVKDYWDDNYLENEFYLRDVKDGVVVVVDHSWENCFGIPYTVNGDFVVLNYEAKVPYISDWRPKVGAETTNMLFDNGNEQFMKYSIEKAIEKTTAKVKEEYSNKEAEQIDVKATEEYKAVESELNTAKSQFEVLNAEVVTLREFKLNEENQKAFEIRKVEVDKIIADFSFEEDEIKGIREEAYSNQKTIEELENALYTLEGRKLHASKKQFSADPIVPEVEKSIVAITETEVSKDVYGSATKYFNK